VADLPAIIPLFPLPNLVLFPGIRIPLHIFEPRYRQMIADVAGNDGIIGMMLLKGDTESDYHSFSDIYEVGCAGRIGGLVRLDDGRYNLLLDGISEFRVRREIRGRAYRQADVEWCPVPREALECDAETMDGLRELLFAYLGDAAREAWKSLVEQQGLTGAALVNFLCFHLDLAPIEKQTMLEAMTRRVDCLIDILTFQLEERKHGPSGTGGGDALQ
jgi:uncharacterized protein